MDWTNTLGCIGKFALYGLGIFGVICIIAITVSRKFNRGVKAAVESQPKPKQGRVVLREVVEGMAGMEDSYIAEIRDLGSGDMRLQVYDVGGHLIMESRVDKCRELGVMIAITNIKKEFGGERIEKDPNET